ncbi:unnamed protein product, partial [Iphiclides podalirius]
MCGEEVVKVRLDAYNDGSLAALAESILVTPKPVGSGRPTGSASDEALIVSGLKGQKSQKKKKLVTTRSATIQTSYCISAVKKSTDVPSSVVVGACNKK